jgi:diacylglycerol kinase family enzyme
MEKLGARKFVAMSAALMMLLWNLRAYNLRIESGGKGEFITTPFVFLGNNRYEPQFLSYPSRESLTDGVLSAFYSHGIGRLGMARIALMAFLGQVSKSPEVKIFEAAELTVRSRRKRLRVSRDGEIGWMRPPLHYRILPKAIDVLSPPGKP